jgi:hypothetical protein
VPSGELLKEAILTSVIERAEKNGGFVTREELTAMPVPSRGTRRIIDASRGIWNPRDMDATLSLVSSPAGPDADREVEGGLFHYSYRSGSINGDNLKLRRAFELGVPIMYEIQIAHKLLDEVDGAMLRHGLQEMHGADLTTPSRKKDQPDRDRLAERYSRFLLRASSLNRQAGCPS